MPGSECEGLLGQDSLAICRLVRGRRWQSSRLRASLWMKRQYMGTHWHD